MREARKKKFSTFLVLYSAKTLKKWFSGRFGYQKNELRSALRFENQTDLIKSALKHLKIWPDLDLKGGVINSNTPVMTDLKQKPEAVPRFMLKFFDRTSERIII